MKSSLRIALAFAVCTLIGTAAAQAQATRTWVSGEGDDANPCSRTAPCKTLAGAISKTAAGGEIDLLDPASVGTVTITKSITINGAGAFAGILASAANGISINSAGAVVTLRNLSISAPAAISVFTGIRMLDGASLLIDHVTIAGFGSGVEITTGNAVIIDSTITQNSEYGVHALIGSTIAIEDSTLTNNGVAVQADSGATIRLSNNGIYNNLTGFGCGGTLASANNNRKANNVGGSVAACSPNAVLTVQ